MTDPNERSSSSESFEASAGRKQSGIVVEFWQFLRHSRSWWLIPIVIAVLVLGFAMFVGTGPLAPLLYTLF